jgi:hypothetical protein
MNKEQLAFRLEQELRAVQAERSGASRDPALAAARTALKQFQSQRLSETHADLLAAPDTRDAALFFFEELYGAHDLSQRDTDLGRIIPTMQRLLPVNALHTITEAIALDALSEQLDSAMARALGEQVDEPSYVAAYREVGTRAQRERQLELVQALGLSLCDLVRVPLLNTTLKMMRAPARLAGLGDLQQFLERGFNAFKRMKKPQDFVSTIVRREGKALENCYAGRRTPFDVA